MYSIRNLELVVEEYQEALDSNQVFSSEVRFKYERITISDEVIRESIKVKLKDYKSELKKLNLEFNKL